jgi:uncharacterized protein YdaU (DUF1376 family)
MPLFPADFFADTAHISRSAAHAYLFLLGHAWLRDGALPNDDAVLARMAGFRLDRWREIKSEVLSFWQLSDDDLLRNKRLTKERDYVTEKSRRNRANGALGGRPLHRNKSQAGYPDCDFNIASEGRRGRYKLLNSHVSTKPNGFFLETEVKAPTPIPIKKDSLNGEKVGRETEPLVFVKEGTEQWNAWTASYRDSKRSPPSAISRQGTNERGWYFPSEWPPSQRQQAPQVP